MSIVRPQTDGDLIADILRRLGDLERSTQLGHASIGSGGLRLLDGGSITVEGGKILWHDDQGRLRLEIAHSEGAANNVRMVYYDEVGNSRAVFGQTIDVGTGAISGEGILVQDAVGEDISRMGSALNGELYAVRDQTSGAILGFLASSLTWGGADVGPGLLLQDSAGFDAFMVLAEQGIVAPNLAAYPHSQELSGGIHPDERTTISSSYTNLWRIDLWRASPRIRVRGFWRSVSGGAGDVRIYDETTATVIGTQAVAASDYIEGNIDGVLPGDLNSFHKVKVQARRTNGTGSIGIAVIGAYVLGPT